MINILEKFYSKVMPVREDFNNNRVVNYLPFILAVITTQILLLLLGKFLWNNYLVKNVTIVNPIDSVIDLIAISFLIKLIIG
tara:strand:- start:249 stop:494 length:246 start_codon:yes stop_codon:yes gene_type:complete